MKKNNTKNKCLGIPWQLKVPYLRLLCLPKSNALFVIVFKVPHANKIRIFNATEINVK